MSYMIKHSKNKVLFLPLLTVVCSLLGLSISPSLATDSQQEVEKKLQKIQKQIVSSQDKIAQDRGELGRYEKQLQNSEKRIADINQQLINTKLSLEQSQQQTKKLVDKKATLQKKLGKHNKILQTQIRSEYFYAGQERIKLLLNQEEPASLGRSLVYYDYIHRARVKEINQVSSVLLAVKNLEAEITQEKNAIESNQANLQSEIQDLKQTQEERNTILASLNTSITTEKAKLSTLKADEKQLHTLIEEIRKALENIPQIDEGQAFAELKGKLYWPVVGKPSNRFGQARSSAQNQMNWDGVFIPSQDGNNVRSIFHGRIAFAEWMRGLGLLIIIDHGDGYMSLYGHNQSLYKQPGEWVQAGERIAAVGNSGGIKQSGLYFEIRKQGKPINPASWCKKPATSRAKAKG